MFVSKGIAVVLAASFVGCYVQAMPFTEARTAVVNGIVERQSGPQGQGIVIMCNGANWTGDCTYMPVALGYDVCTSLEDTPWLYDIGSFEPEFGTACWLQNSTDCSDLCMSPEGCDMIVEFPGKPDLSQYGSPAWIDRVGSFTCENVTVS